MRRGCSRTDAHGLAPFGTTGEALSLGLAERRRLLDALLEGGIDPARLMPGTGLCSIPDTVELCRHAVEAGCGGVMVLPPFYFKGASDDGVFEHFREVIERIADARLRVYLYHIPAPGGDRVPGRSRRSPHRRVPGGRGRAQGQLGATGPTPRRSLAAYPGFRVLSGSETFLLDNLRHGGGRLHHRDRQRQRPPNPLGLTMPFRRVPSDADALQAEISAMRTLHTGEAGDPDPEAPRRPLPGRPGLDGGAPPRSALSRPPTGPRSGPQLERAHGYAPAFPRAATPARVA